MYVQKYIQVYIDSGSYILVQNKKIITRYAIDDGIYFTNVIDGIIYIDEIRDHLYRHIVRYDGPYLIQNNTVEYDYNGHPIKYCGLNHSIPDIQSKNRYGYNTFLPLIKFPYHDNDKYIEGSIYFKIYRTL